MAWVPLNDIADALNRLTQSINAAFLGRSNESNFTAIAQFDLNGNTLTVDFTDKSSGGQGQIISWLWDFGDGSTSALQNPSHTYAIESTYVVSLTVTAATGLKAQSIFAVTVVGEEVDNEAPVAAFTTTTSGLSVLCTDGSSDVDGTIITWEWDFGDSLPTAAFTSNVVGLSVTFTDTSTDVAPGTIASWLWSFGDGTTSVLQNPVKAYSAGGGYSVTLTVTDNEGNLDTAGTVVQVTSGATLGIPFGPFDLYKNSITPGVFTLSQDFTDKNNIIGRLSQAHTDGVKLRIPIAGGDHANYLTNGVFDPVLWKKQVQTLNTTAIKAAVATAVTNGTLLAFTLADEPEHSTWGPPGSFTRPLLDSLALYVRAIFPTVPIGVDHGDEAFYTWRTTERYTVVDHVVSQYSWRVTNGNITDYRNKVLTRAALDGVAVCFSINLLNGGRKINQCFNDFVGSVATTCCPTVGTDDVRTGGNGTRAGVGGQNCKVNNAQLESWGKTLGAAGCGLLMWQYQTAFFGVAGNITSFANIAADLATRPRKSWRRP